MTDTARTASTAHAAHPTDTPRLPALFVLSGLVSGAAAAAPAPVPAREVAEAQLRALNHRFVSAAVDASGELAERLTHEDFLLTESDGAWHGRADFVARVRQQAPRPDAAQVGVQVRLFGGVALVHGVYLSAGVGSEAGGATRMRYTDVHVWTGTGWQLVSVQNTPLADDRVAVALRQGSVPAHAPWTGRDPEGDDLNVLLALNESYVAAFRDADVAWYDAHLSPDYVMVAGDGALLDRAATLTRFAQPTFATSMRSFPVGRVSVRRFEDVALIHAENDYVLKDGRRGVSRYTDIWHLREGRWLCVAAHITVHRAPSN